MPVLVRFTLVLRAFSASLPILRESIDLWNISGITVSVYSFKEFWPQCTCIASKTWFTESIYQDCFLPNKVATRVCCMSFSKSFLACSSSLNGFFGLFSFGFSWGGAPKRSWKKQGYQRVSFGSYLTHWICGPCSAGPVHSQKVLIHKWSLRTACPLSYQTLCICVFWRWKDLEGAACQLDLRP